MTSSVAPATNPANAAQNANAASSTASGTTSPLAALPVQSSARSYANATKKPFSPPPIASSTPPVAVGNPVQPQHGKADSASPVNGRNPVQPTIANMASPTIANGAPSQGDHSRKPSSFTISASGTSGYMPNGGPVGQTGRPPINFGFMNAGGSPAIANSVPNHPQNASLATPMSNPRVTSPATSPSPIPQPAASGGRPPSGLHNSGNGLSFGSMGGDSSDHSARPTMPQGPASQPQHLRRESTHSTQSDMSTPGMNMNRGGPPNGGRARGGYGASFVPPTTHSPAPAFRQMSNPRPGGPNVPPQFQNQAPMGHPNSPYRATRSPALAPAALQQQPHLANAPMYGGYPQHLQPQQPGPYGMPQGYDPAYAAYFNMQTGMHPSMYYQGAPPSPRPFVHTPHGAQQQYMQGQYSGAPNAQVMSRTSSQVSERPSSTLGQPQTPSMPPASHVSQTPNPTAGSPAPNANFTLPTKSKTKVRISRPDGQELHFEKGASSTAPAPSRSPVVVSSTPTPPPRAPSSTDASHNRTESKSQMTDAEKKAAFQEQVRKQLEADQAEEKRKAEEEEQKIAKEKADAEAQAAKEKEEADAKAAKEKEEAEKAAAEAEEAKEDAEKAKADEEEKARLQREEDERLEREIAEMEELERQEEERERAYQEKKKKEAEEKARKEAEAAANLDEELRRAEREAEEAEEARQKGKPAEEESETDKAERDKIFASLKKPAIGPGATVPSESGASTPASDASMPPPSQPAQPAQPAQPKPLGAARPKPAALKLETNKQVEPAQPTAGMQALRSARFLQVKNEAINYPDGIKSPNPALQQGSKSRGRQYDKDFLLQFQDVFKEKPSIDWDNKIRETIGDGTDSARPPSARGTMSNRQPLRPPMPPSGLSQMGQSQMGHFQGGRTIPPGTTSEQRFLASGQARAPPMVNPLAGLANRPAAFPMGGPVQMARTASFQSMAQAGPTSQRAGSQRGSSRRNKVDASKSKREEEQAAKAMPLTAGQELKPLQASGTGWKPTSIGQGAAGPALPSGHLTPDLVQRKVKAALNKMTPENFEKISDQILQIAAQSKDETDGRTLRQVIQLTFEKACDEAHWASMYAKFCHRMLTSMSSEIKDENVVDKNGRPVVGGALFRKYLLNRCQEEFERGWEVNLPEKPEGQTEEAAMLSDEYYIAAAAKRRGLGLIQFIGELYKLGMLTLRIMHECVLKLLNFEGMPDESAIESLVKLLRTVGATMEAAENGPKMISMYFDRIEKIMTIPGLPSRMNFMLLDIVDLRKRGWRSKDDNKGPKTIQEIHEEAQAAQQAAELERQRSSQRGGSGGGRPPMGRGDVRSFSGGGMMPPPDYPRNQIGMDDLRKLSKGASGRNVSQGGPSSFGPSFLGPRSSSGRKGLGPGMMSRGEDSGGSSRTGTPPVKEKESTTHTNAFSALASLDPSGEGADDVASPPSAASSPPVSKSIPANIGSRARSPAGDADKANEGADGAKSEES